MGTVRSKILKGDRVETHLRDVKCIFTDRHWGVVNGINVSNGTFSITFDDGSVHNHLPMEWILKRIESSLPSAPKVESNEIPLPSAPQMDSEQLAEFNMGEQEGVPLPINDDASVTKADNHVAVRLNSPRSNESDALWRWSSKINGSTD